MRFSPESVKSSDLMARQHLHLRPKGTQQERSGFSGKKPLEERKWFKLVETLAGVLGGAGVFAAYVYYDTPHAKEMELLSEWTLRHMAERAWIGALAGGFAARLLGGPIYSFFESLKTNEGERQARIISNTIHGLDDPRRRWMIQTDTPILATRYLHQNDEMEIYLTNGRLTCIDGTTGVEKRGGAHTLELPGTMITSNIVIDDWQWVTSGGTLTAFKGGMEQWHLKLCGEVIDIPIIDARVLQGNTYLHSQPAIHALEAFHYGTTIIVIRRGSPAAFSHDPYTGDETGAYTRKGSSEPIPYRPTRISKNTYALPFEDGDLVYFGSKRTNKAVAQFKMGADWKNLWFAGYNQTHAYIACPHAVVAFKMDGQK